MKPEQMRDHSGPADNHAAARLSHEAFVPPAKPAGMPQMAHLDKAPCPPGQRPEIPAPVAPRPIERPPVQPPKVDIPRPIERPPVQPPKVEVPPKHDLPPKHDMPAPHQSDKNPCPPGKTPDVPVVVVPPKAPDVPVVVVPPRAPEVPVVVVPPRTPDVPVVVVPPRTPEVPVVVVPPRTPDTVVTTPAPRPPRPEVREVVRYSPPAEPARPFRSSDYVAPPAAVKETPAEKVTQKTTIAAEVSVVRRKESEQTLHIPAAISKERTTHSAAKIVDKSHKETHATHDAGHAKAKVAPPSDKTHPATEKAHPPIVEKKHQPDVHTHSHKAVHKAEKAHVVAEAKSKIVEKEVVAPAVVATTREAEVVVATAKVTTEQSTERVQAPAAEVTQPAASAGSSVWGEASVSYSPGSKTTVGTATVGKFFDQQNYGYVQGTADLTRGKVGNVSAMVGHSVLTPYDEAGNVRRGNVNVEAGVIVNTGESLEGSKLPIFGKSAVRVGVNGYYNLDEAGKTTAYAAADYASNPKQADLQVGVQHKFTDVTVSAGYQVSKVEGYKAGQYATTSASMKLNDRADLYVGAAIAMKSDRKDDKVYAGVLFHF